MILSFGDAVTRDLYDGKETGRIRRLPVGIARIAIRKLDMLNVAKSTEDLRVPPGNRFEHLKGALAGFCSIRSNDQWRIIFRWERGNASDVRITDYH